jgi:integrase
MQSRESAKPQRSSEEMQQLIEAISTDRFATYLSACRDDHAKALQLYEWDADLCGAFYAPLQVVEVAFRNTLHRQLSSIYGVNWPVSEIFTKIAPALAALVTEVQRSLDVSRNKKALSSIQAWRIVKAAAKRAGIEKDVSPHFLRHSHASHAIEKGCKVTTLRDTLGHSSIAVTDRYAHARPGESSGDVLAV